MIKTFFNFHLLIFYLSILFKIISSLSKQKNNESKSKKKKMVFFHKRELCSWPHQATKRLAVLGRSDHVRFFLKKNR